jgi:hypothetical protein
MLDSIPYPLLIIIAVFMAVAPVLPMPHLVEKLIMLKNGTLIKPLDIFDLLLHATPLMVLAAKLIKDYALKG